MGHFIKKLPRVSYMLKKNQVCVKSVTQELALKVKKLS